MDNEYIVWIKKAEQDLDASNYLIKGKKYEESLFFLQQSVEKALKYVYIKKFKRLIKTHDLVLLAREIKAPENILEKCKRLTLAYQYTRYPDIPIVEDIKKETLNFLNFAKEVLKWVKENI